MHYLVTYAHRPNIRPSKDHVFAGFLMFSYPHCKDLFSRLLLLCILLTLSSPRVDYQLTMWHTETDGLTSSQDKSSRPPYWNCTRTYSFNLFRPCLATKNGIIKSSCAGALARYPVSVPAATKKTFDLPSLLLLRPQSPYFGHIV